jgi:hypothetical protein
MLFGLLVKLPHRRCPKNTACLSCRGKINNPQSDVIVSSFFKNSDIAQASLSLLFF